MEGKAKPPKYAYFAYKTDRRAFLLDALSKISVAVVVATYAVSCIAIAFSDAVTGIGFVLISALSFLVLSLSRRLFNAKRPYELYDVSDIAPELDGRRRGLSFPSRHVFSAFLIGTMLLFSSWPLGSAVILLGVIIALCRVLLLIHFPGDVIAGAVIGLISGIVGAFALEFWV